MADDKPPAHHTLAQPLDAHKSSIRARVWPLLRRVALPDSRFDFDFSSFIADFAGSPAATALLVALPAYRAAPVVFITPDNCLEGLRAQALRDGKRVLVTSYGIRRGFWLLDPAGIPPERIEFAATLDGMERVGRAVSLAELAGGVLGTPRLTLMVTGTGAVNIQGVRFGKGHGFMDLEFSLLFEIGVIDLETVTACVVHDCQVLEEKLHPEVFDTVCDYVITPTRVIEVEGAQKPECGILFDRLQPGMLESIPPLRELKAMKGR